MQMPHNAFKQALREGRPQIGLWLGLAHANAAELLAGTGFDWLLIDGEHAPNDLQSILAQLRAVAPYPAQPIVRPPTGDAAQIKQLLDLGAQTLLVPMVDSARQAHGLAQAMRYPPHGIRGVGSALARSSRWNQVRGYLQQADAQMCLLVQAETTAALAQLDAIAAQDGVDGVFFGPADLSASMGLLGQPGHPDVVAAICDGIRRVRAAGKAPGVLAADPELAATYLAHGALFVAVGVDTTLLVGAASRLARQYRASGSDEPSRSGIAQAY
ncbi:MULTISPECIES: 4-hydroxy-2-oxoheptanedioate aldolase [Ralstonia solanacearum species complex]|uniref:4-hydroxy-2-oxoheptanedioate aldolase n=2 Tax=Ralstonia TaxID=48736 RepID=A0ABX8A4E4_9RALS|nr:4-hydroxy-2-oxoheptanedioate aldolase [Ralstonia nicotianae]MCK4124475.1 4-hydroxy-2-oxoheptanedioate aldolase [Ralstonia pseudosolanacearum]QUP61559.1 4-hydroxy-2-oxoheptanedioate aldolase [Ralstonia nicotianae]